jgi:O-antigen/teichoic acid export membrane protein
MARFILANQAGVASLGAYAAAFGLSRPLDIIFLWASATLMPTLLAAYEEHGAEAARAESRRIFTLISALAIPAAIGLALVATPLATLLIGEGLRADAARALPWLAFAALISGFNLYYWSEAFQLTRRTALRALVMLAPGALQIVLTLWLAQPLGAAGAAIAAGAASLLGAGVLALAGRSLLALPLPLGALTRIALASAAMAAVIFALPRLGGLAELALSVTIGALTYAAAAIALNINGLRSSASALSQALSIRLRAAFHSLFTDRADVRAP